MVVCRIYLFNYLRNVGTVCSWNYLRWFWRFRFSRRVVHTLCASVLRVHRSLARSGHMIFPSASFGEKFSSTFDSETTRPAGCCRICRVLLRFILGLVHFTKFYMYCVFHTLNIQMTLMRAIELYLHNYNRDIPFIFTVVLVD